MRRIGPLALAVVGAVALAGCGSSSNEATTTTTPAAGQRQGPQGAPGGQALAQLQACLKKHGVTLPSGPQGGGQPPQGGSGQPPRMDSSAFKACQKYLPQGGPGAGGGPPGMAPPGSSS